jgi:transcriptional regulator with XRE-family HTH domain
MTQTVVERLIQTREGERLFRQEQVILDVTELICRVMDEDGVSRSQLAKRLGKSKGYVSQLLDGEHNMTIRTISDVFCALGRTVHFHSENTEKEAPVMLGHPVWQTAIQWRPDQWVTVSARPGQMTEGLAC